MEPATACPTVHKTSSAVWDVPSPVAVNSTFTVKVGVLCSASCGLATRHVAIQDDTGEPLEGVEVRLGLYTASTGLNGRAEVELPEGRVELTIRKDGFAAPPLTLEVTKSLSTDVRATSVPTRAEMDEKLLADYPWG